MATVKVRFYAIVNAHGEYGVGSACPSEFVSQEAADRAAQDMANEELGETEHGHDSLQIGYWGSVDVEVPEPMPDGVDVEATVTAKGPPDEA